MRMPGPAGGATPWRPRTLGEVLNALDAKLADAKPSGCKEDCASCATRRHLDACMVDLRELMAGLAADQDATALRVVSHVAWMGKVMIGIVALSLLGFLLRPRGPIVEVERRIGAVEKYLSERDSVADFLMRAEHADAARLLAKPEIRSLLTTKTTTVEAPRE